MGWYEGMDPEFARRLQALIEASGGRIGVGSGYRSVEEQTALWNKALADHGGDEEATRMVVAPPGKSNHNFGVAADLSWSEDGQQWAHDNAERFGLVFPMGWEPWHIEPVGVREGTYNSQAPSIPTEATPGTAEAYTTTPAGSRSPVDATQRFDLGYQLVSLNNILMASSMTPAVSAPSGGLEAPGPAVTSVSTDNSTTGAAPRDTLTGN